MKDGKDRGNTEEEKEFLAPIFIESILEVSQRNPGNIHRRMCRKLREKDKNYFKK